MKKLVALILSVTMTMCFSIMKSSAEDTNNYAEGSLLIKVAYGTAVCSIAPVALHDCSVKFLIELTPEATGEHSVWYEINFSDITTEKMYSLLSSCKSILDINYNYELNISSPCSLPSDDEVYSSSLPLEDSYSCGVQQCYDAMNNAGIEGKGKGLVVAVLDYGIDYTHPALADKIWKNSGEIWGDGIDNDNNGVIDDYYGPNFADSTRFDPFDVSSTGHGTHIAGIIAADGIGIAPDVKIMAIKVLGETNTLSNVVNGINYAIKYKADIINMSLGAYGYTSSLQSAIEQASASALLFAAAGNEGLPNSTINGIEGKRCYPASFTNVIGVMNEMDYEGDYGWLHSTSNWDTLTNPVCRYELMAPGMYIYSTLPGGNYGSLSGTSCSSPYAAGVAALVVAKLKADGNYSINAAKKLLLDCARMKLGKVYNNTDFYYGEINAYNCISDKTDISLNKLLVLDNCAETSSGYVSYLGIELANSGADAQIDSISVSCDDANIVFDKDTITLDPIWSLKTSDNGIVYADNKAVDVKNPFVFHYIDPTYVAKDINFTLTVVSHVTGQSLIDTRVLNTTVSTFDERMLPSTLTASYVFVPGGEYFVRGPITVPAGNDVTIPDGITLTFGKGNETNAYISVEGNLNISGVKLGANITNYVNIFTCGDGKFSIKDSEIIKPKLTVDSATGCTFRNTSPGQYIISKQLNTSRFLGFGDCTYPAYITANTINTCLFDKCGSHITAQSLILSVFKDCENSSVSGVISAFTNNSFLSKLSFINTQGDAFAASDNYWNGVSYIDVLDMFSDPSLINTDRLLSVPSQDCYPFVYKYTSSVDEYNANFKIILYYNNSLSVLPTVTAEAYGVSNASYNLTVSGSDGCYTALGNFVGTYSSADFSVSGGISLGVVPAELSGIAPVKLTGYELYTDIVATKSSVTINLRNNSPTTKQYFFTVAQYSGGKLICINMSATTTIGGYKNAIINPVFSLAMNTDTVKIFLANRIGRLSPYIPATVFTNLQ